MLASLVTCFLDVNTAPYIIIITMIVYCYYHDDGE